MATKGKGKSKNAPKGRQSQQGNAAAGKEKGGFFGYIQGIRQELRKVVWLTKEELATDTVMVFVACTFFALAFWLIDTGFLALLKKMLGVTLT